MHYLKNIAMPLIDTHAHLDFYTETPSERTEVLRRAHAAGVHTILAIGIGEGPDTMHQALDIATATNDPTLPTVYASAGIHPQEAASATPEALAKLSHPRRRPPLHRHRRDRPRLLPPRKPHSPTSSNTPSSPR